MRTSNILYYISQTCFEFRLPKHSWTISNFLQLENSLASYKVFKMSKEHQLIIHCTDS